jgi:hypothetical protein
MTAGANRSTSKRSCLIISVLMLENIALLSH